MRRLFGGLIDRPTICRRLQVDGADLCIRLGGR